MDIYQEPHRPFGVDNANERNWSEVFPDEVDDAEDTEDTRYGDVMEDPMYGTQPD